MRIAQEAFQGTVPRLAPQRLGPSNAQNAMNARLQSGDLEAWRQFALEHTLSMSAPVESIYLLNGAWLSWAADVDAARGPVPGDQTFRLYLTGPAVYDQPQFTDYSMATSSGSSLLPVLTRPLGVPAPDFPPTAFYNTIASGVDIASSLTTSYIYTYVNDLGNESAPSGASNTIAAPTGDLNIITEITGIQAAIPSGFVAEYNIVSIRLYRAATGATGTAFRFVEEVTIPALMAFNPVDSLGDAQLGEVCPSLLWDVPPADLRGVLALPNSVMAGFSGNQLCLSAQGFPHAWPVSYRLTTDTDIVGIGNIDTTVVIFTESFLYVATGSDPSQYSMAKFEVPYAGVSKRSIAYLDNIGVVGATANGLRAVAGIGQSANLTKGLFTRQQWQALNPSSILGIAHDDIYFFFYDKGGSDGKGGYALDASPGGFGLVPLSFHASAAYVNPQTDQLFLVLDAMDEPFEALLDPSTAPTPDGRTIYEFDSPNGNGFLVYQYRGKQNLLDRPMAFNAAELRGNDNNVVFRVIADQVVVYEGLAMPGIEFTLTGFTDTCTTVEIELVGTSRVKNVRIAEDMDEIGLQSMASTYNET